MQTKSSSYGYPKMGPNRELKKALEAFWKGQITQADLLKEAEEINFARIKKQKAAGIDIIPSNDFSLYDPVLDLSLMFNVIPERFKSLHNEIELYFAMARGNKTAVACEMTKWFDTNYHYIVPEFNGQFQIRKNVPLENFLKVKNALNIVTKPVLVGPFTYIASGKISSNQKGVISGHTEKGDKNAHFKEMVFTVSKLYNQLLTELEKEGAEWVQLDEPALVVDRTDAEIDILIDAYKIVTQGLTKLNVVVQTYYESVSHYTRIVNELPVAAIGLDLVSNSENLANIEKNGFPKNKTLFAGLISGRDIWKTEFKTPVDVLKKIDATVVITNAAPLSHLPHTVADEKGHLEEKLLSLLAYADERLQEIQVLKEIVSGKKELPQQDFAKIRSAFTNTAVRAKQAAINESKIGRKTVFKTRYQLQRRALNLPAFPTTTIGSFPQTNELREKRKAFRAGQLSQVQYDAYIESKIQDVVKLQEEIGLDVFVHGEFERTDMVEFFGEKLQGFAFSKNGWVQSYGSRMVKPPIIFGDVSRPEAMTVAETAYAQTLTQKPMKGMLTGPVTILNWSFYRKDISKKEIAYQIGLALHDEVSDLEKAGIRIIQIDEPAFREGLPLKKSKQKDYLDWAVKSFKLTHDMVKDETQVHTHMCYSEFNEIIDSINAMDADVISIEASRSRGEILEAFETFNYDHGIGLGVYDIHSPRVPAEQEMLEIAKRSLKVIDKDLIWINPDCGLKTRGQEETVAALKNMVAIARVLKETAVTI